MTKVESLNQILEELNCKNKPIVVVDCLKEIIAILDNTRDLSNLYTIVDCLNTIVAIKTKKESLPNNQTKVESLQELLLLLDNTVDIRKFNTISDCLRGIGTALGSDSESETITDILFQLKDTIVTAIENETHVHNYHETSSTQGCITTITKTCDCGDVITEQITNHEEILDEELSTKRTDVYVCKYCNTFIREQPHVHDYSNVDSTSTQGCVTTTIKSCRCGSQTTETSESHTEMYDANRSDEEYYVIVCENCGKVLREEEVANHVNHIFKETDRSTTGCITTVTKTCFCGQTETERLENHKEILDELSSDDETLIIICENCGELIREELRADHVHDFKNATSVTEGCYTTVTKTCICGETETSTEESHEEVYSEERSNRKSDVYVCANCGKVLRTVSKES